MSPKYAADTSVSVEASRAEIELEAVEAGISTIEDEFMAHLVLPDGQTVSQWLGPQIDDAYRLGNMPAMLAIGPAAD